MTGQPRAIVRRGGWLAVLLALTARAHAGGFYVPEIGSRAVAESGAMTARADDATTIVHNPAGLASLSPRLELAGTLFLPAITHFRRPVTDPSSGATIGFPGARNTSTLAAAPFLGAAFHAGVPRLTLGAALFAPFGATLEYPKAGAQRFVVTRIALRTIFVGPAAAYRVTPSFSVGASLDYVYSDIALDQANAIQFVTGDPEQSPNPDAAVVGENRLTGKDKASFSATLGVRYQAPSGRLAAGASVMTPATLHFKGDIDARNPAIAELRDSANGNALLQPAGRRTDGLALDIPLPLIVRAGVLFRPRPRLSVALDVNWQRWSAFDKMVIRFDHHYDLLPTPGANLYDVTLENHWKDTFTVRVGAAWQPWWCRPVEFRAGVLFDQSPIDDRHFDVMTPDSDKLGVSAGVGTTVRAGGRRVQLDAGFLHLFMAERDVAPSGGRPGSDRTILNKPAPSFFHGVTRARVEVIGVSVALSL